MQYLLQKLQPLPAKCAVPPANYAAYKGVIPKLSPKLSPKDVIPLQIVQYPLQSVQHPLQIMQYPHANNAGDIELSPSYPQSYPQRMRSPCKSCSTPCKLCSTPCKLCSPIKKLSPSYPQTNWGLKNKFKCFILTEVMDFTERAVSFTSTLVCEVFLFL